MNRQQFKERNDVIVRMFKSGQTMEEVGAVFSITKQGVRHVIKGRGICASEGGGALKRVKAREHKKADKTEAYSRFRYLCSAAELNEAVILIENSGHKGKFRDSERAKRIYRAEKSKRLSEGNYEWKISFPEWLSIWLDSGKWSEKGSTRDGGYIMARPNILEPLTRDNAVIVKAADYIGYYNSEAAKLKKG